MEKNKLYIYILYETFVVSSSYILSSLSILFSLISVFLNYDSLIVQNSILENIVFGLLLMMFYIKSTALAVGVVASLTCVSIAGRYMLQGAAEAFTAYREACINNLVPPTARQPEVFRPKGLLTGDSTATKWFVGSVASLPDKSLESIADNIQPNPGKKLSLKTIPTNLALVESLAKKAPASHPELYSKPPISDVDTDSTDTKTKKIFSALGYITGGKMPYQVGIPQSDSKESQDSKSIKNTLAGKKRPYEDPKS